jgi:hypothetical protein
MLGCRSLLISRISASIPRRRLPHHAESAPAGAPPSALCRPIDSSESSERSDRRLPPLPFSLTLPTAALGWPRPPRICCRAKSSAVIDPAPAGGTAADPAPAGGAAADPAPAGGVAADPAPAGGTMTEPAPAGGAMTELDPPSGGSAKESGGGCDGSEPPPAGAERRPMRDKKDQETREDPDGLRIRPGGRQPAA